MRLLLNFAAHKRAQVEVVELGLDRVLWANWSPRASEEVRSLSSMVLHNVRAGPIVYSHNAHSLHLKA